MGTRPRHRIVPVDLEEQLQLGEEERVVVGLLEVEEREGDARRTPSGDRFDPAWSECGGRRQLLEDPDVQNAYLGG